VSLYDQISESAFTAQVIRMAQVFKWRVAHFRPGMTKRGRWVTAMSGNIGFFDLVLIGKSRTIFAELKSAKGKLTEDQKEWIARARECPGVETYVWYPKDIEMIESILR